MANNERAIPDFFDVEFAPATLAGKTQPETAPAQTSNKFRREIDLGDGSGKQVFEANTLEALTDALVQAQTNATRKIRELSRRQKLQGTPDTEYPVARPKPVEATKVTDDMVFLFGSDNRTQRTVLEKLMSLEAAVANDLQDRQYQQQSNEVKISAARQFLGQHPECSDPKISQAIEKYIDSRKWPVTAHNLELALEGLVNEGVIEIEEEPASGTPEQPTGIQSEQTQPQPKPVSTGVSEAMNVTPVQTPSKDTGTQIVAELDSLPTLEQKRARIAQLMYEMRQRNSQ